MASSGLESATFHLKVCESQTILQQFLDGFGPAGPFCQSVIVIEFITDDLLRFVAWYISEETDVKANESIWRLKANRLHHL
jgi:hypothetical protein